MLKFSTLLLPTEEDCKTACLADCNCEAVLFKNGVQKIKASFEVWEKNSK